MRKLIIILSLLTIVVACGLEKKASYNFPAEMPPHVKAAYQEQCDKGSILYDIHCGGCHTTVVKGKKNIPDFSPSQLAAYELRILSPKHEDVMSEVKLPAEDLGLITTFLTYKKRAVPKK